MHALHRLMSPLPLPLPVPAYEQPETHPQYSASSPWPGPERQRAAAPRTTTATPVLRCDSSTSVATGERVSAGVPLDACGFARARQPRRQSPLCRRGTIGKIGKPAAGSIRIISFPAAGRSSQARDTRAHAAPLGAPRSRPRLKAEGAAPHVAPCQVHALHPPIITTPRARMMPSAATLPPLSP